MRHEKTVSESRIWTPLGALVRGWNRKKKIIITVYVQPFFLAVYNFTQYKSDLKSTIPFQNCMCKKCFLDEFLTNRNPFSKKNRPKLLETTKCSTTQEKTCVTRSDNFRMSFWFLKFSKKPPKNLTNFCLRTKKVLKSSK